MYCNKTCLYLFYVILITASIAKAQTQQQMADATCAPGTGRTYPIKISTHLGKCTQNITAENECRTAAENNAKSGFGVKGYGGIRWGSYYPYGCFEQNGYYYFNPDFKSRTQCSSYRSCICRTDVCHNCVQNTYNDQKTSNGICKRCAPGKWNSSYGLTSQNSCVNAPRPSSCAAGYVTDTVRIRSSGSCNAKVLSYQECKQAMYDNIKYNFDNVSTYTTNIYEEYSSYYPPGCIFQGSNGYRYNANIHSTRNCDGWSKCVCETTKCVSLSSQNGTNSSYTWKNNSDSQGQQGSQTSNVTQNVTGNQDQHGSQGSTSNVITNTTSSVITTTATPEDPHNVTGNQDQHGSQGPFTTTTSSAITTTPIPENDTKKEIIKLRQNIQITGLRHFEVASKKVSIESAIAKTLGVPDTDVEITSITEIDARRRHLLATKVLIVYEVKAKDEKSKKSLETTMKAAAFLSDLNTNMVAETSYSGFSITVEPPVVIIISTTARTTTDPSIKASSSGRKGSRGNSPTASDEEDMLSRAISSNWLSRVSFSFTTILMIQLSL